MFILEQVNAGDLKRREYFGIFFACLLLACVQTAHFYLYFEQAFWLSLKWSVKGSVIWFLIFTGVLWLVRHSYISLTRTASSILLWSVLGLFCGALQILVAISMDFLLGTASRPFLEDFLHLYNKRWLQNLLVFGLIVMGWRLSHKAASSNSDAPAPLNEEIHSKVKISDGSKTHWLQAADISHIEALGNYVCVHALDDQHIIRSTLKQLEDELSGMGFIRISRSSIVNQNYIQSYQKSGRNTFELTTSSGHRLAVGRTYWKNVKAVLGL